MTSPRPSCPRPRRLALVLAALAALACGPAAPPARGQLVQPWAPAGDSLTRRASSAKIRFQRQLGDSVGGDNLEAYDIVGGMGRSLLASLGRSHLSQARALQATLDSLGLDVEVATDPAQSAFVLMLVRNPFRRESDAVGYLYWFRGDDLRMQGSSFPAAHDVSLKVWWSGQPPYPYEAVVLFEQTRAPQAMTLRLFRMSPDAYYWNLVQYEGHGPDFGPGTQASLVDMNLDGLPEVLARQEAEPDSFLVLRGGVPQIVNEFVYTERPEGFVLHDVRALPGPAETLRLFTQLLVDHQNDRARRLLLKPAALDSMLARGWGRHANRGAWTVEYGEPGQAWPEWLELRIREDSGSRRWIFHFYVQDGRWVIRDWIPVQEKSPRPPVAPAGPAGRSGP